MVRHTAHGGLLFLGLATVTGGQGQIQLLGGGAGIIVEHFIEVAQPEKQNTVLIFLFYFIVLPLHGRQFFIFGGQDNHTFLYIN